MRDSGSSFQTKGATSVAMTKISGTGQFRSDGAQALMQSVMTVDAVVRASSENPVAQAISITIHEKLPLMNGQTGCEVEVQLTPDQAARFAHKVLEMVSQSEPVTSASGPARESL